MGEISVQSAPIRENIKNVTIEFGILNDFSFFDLFVKP
jgi:hypothetical protein